MLPILVGGGIFISAFLLFFIQPLLAKHLLPQFGGSAFVWITSMLFFQAGLLLGYLYAYLLAKLPSLRWQVGIHFLLVAVSIYYIPLDLNKVVIQTNQWPPISVILMLSSMILIPFTVISASSPLLQHWYCRLKETDFPYYFYAISNAGSLLGLLGYPFLIEPLIGLTQQAAVWTGLYLSYCLLCLCFMWQLVKRNPIAIPVTLTTIAFSKVFFWIFLSFLSSALLLAITQFLSQNMMNLPLMWVAPLSLYLISFIVTFSNARGYDRSFWFGSFAIWLGLTLLLLYSERLNGYDAILSSLALLYSACMICHGELIKNKPAAAALTTFYLLIAFGSVLGSLFVNLVAYVLLGKWWDFYIPLCLITGVVFSLAYQQYRVLSTVSVSLFLIAFTFILFNPVSNMIAEKRSLFGYIRVFEHHSKNNKIHFRELRHGSTIHGMQFLDRERQQWPTTYYAKNSGIGLAIQYLHAHRNRPLQIAVIGLGCGTIAMLTTKGDHIDFYEVDADVITFAKNYFTFLKNSPATIQILLGDARLSLIKKIFAINFKGYDLIVADAFSGDAIPFHLLTREAMSLYQQLLAPKGIVAFNTSNIFINLMPVTQQLANNHHLAHWWLKTASDLRIGQMRSDWALLSADPALAAWLNVQPINILPNTNHTIDWSDDHNSILPLLKIRLL